MVQPRKIAERIIQHTRSKMALEEQAEGVRDLEMIVGELACEIALGQTRDLWKP